MLFALNEDSIFLLYHSLHIRLILFERCVKIIQYFNVDLKIFFLLLQKKKTTHFQGQMKV